METHRQQVAEGGPDPTEFEENTIKVEATGAGA
jgi:hypothetical protein